jgi:hypothetical protein
MVSRRHVLHLGAGALAATAGCLSSTDDSTDTDGPTGQTSPTDAGDGPTTTPHEDLPAMEPTWRLSFDDANVLGLDARDEMLYLTLSANGGPSSVAAVDPAERAVVWRTQSEGEAVAGSHASSQGIARSGWGATVTDGTVYSVAGPAEEREWTALHALDRETGDRRWSLLRDRELGVAGVREDLVVATGLEFFPGPEQTPVSHRTPEEPLVTVVYGLDSQNGEVRWKRAFEDVADVAVSPDGIFVGTGTRLVGLDEAGETTFTLDRGPATGVEATTGRVYYLTGDPYGDDGPQTLHGVAPGGGREWHHDMPVRELLIDGDRLFAGGDAVAAVDPDGTVVWRHRDHGQWLLLDPDSDSLYTRSGVQADAATAYDTTGDARWTFDPPVNNAWPEAATADWLLVDTVPGTSYAVNAEGEATATLERETVFDALGLNGTIFVGDARSQLLAIDL